MAINHRGLLTAVKRALRIAGALYLLVVVLGGVAQLAARAGIRLPGAATSAGQHHLVCLQAVRNGRPARAAGPGIPGIPTVTEPLARYDLVGVGPRGTGKSRPVRCSGSTDERQTLPYATEQALPTNSAEERQTITQVTRYAAQCRALNGDLLDHVGTLPFARDLDVLRAALGDARINLLGFSYGTFLSQVVANTLPGRTGALVLDGMVEPAWATGAHDTISWIRQNSDVGGWETLQRFFQLCAQAGPQGCAFAADGDPADTFPELATQLRMTPLQIAPAGQPPGAGLRPPRHLHRRAAQHRAGVAGAR